MMRSPKSAERGRLLNVVSFVLIGAVLLVYAGLWAVYPHSLNPGDELIYARNAWHFGSHFEIVEDSIQSHRLGLVLPLAFIYRVAGLGILTTHLLPLLAALGVILTVAWAVPGPRARVFGAILALTCVPLLHASTRLYPDIMAAALMAVAVQLLVSREPDASGGPRRGRPVLLALVLLVAFLAKLTAYWALPMLLLVFVLDSRRPGFRAELRRFYAPMLAAMLFLGVAYLIVCEALWDDPLARLRAVAGVAGNHRWSWQTMNAIDQIHRLSIGPLEKLDWHFGTPVLVLAMIGLVFGSPRLRLWGVYMFSILLIFWFGSTSLERYEPMPLAIRMLHPVIGPVLILAAEGASALTVRLEKRFRFALPVAAVVLLAVTGPAQLRNVRRSQLLRTPALSAIEIVRAELARQPEDRLVLITSDERSPYALAFHFDFAFPSNLDVVPFAEVTPDRIADGRIWIWADPELSASGKRFTVMRDDAPLLSSLGYPARFNTRRLSLYEVDDPAGLLEAMERRDRWPPGLEPSP